jgi:DNA-binding SARP family transcriptional activator
MTEGDAGIDVALLGTPRWRAPHRPDTPLVRKDAALLALLSLEAEPSRDRIAAWLWPEVPLAGAQLNLRQRLHRLRRDSGHALVTPGATLRLLPGCRVDVAAEPIDPDAGALLGDADYGELEAFDDWLQRQRQLVQQRRVDAWAQRIAVHEAAGALAAAIDGVQRLLALDPWHEHGWRRLIRLHYLRGDRASALAAFQRFEREVCAPQGLRPSGETLALLRAVEQTDARSGGPAPLPASLVRPPLLVGRDADLAALNAAWAAGRAVLVLGDGGIGKSRLLAEALRDRPGALRVGARPGDAAVPYATAVTLLVQVRAAHPTALDEPARAELARLLPDLGLPAAQEAREPVLWRAVESLLHGAAEAGLGTVAVDDLHLADPASFELLRWLVASPRLVSLSWAMAARPDELTAVAPRLDGWVGESGGVQRLPLRPLDGSAVAQLLESLALGELPVPDLAGSLLRHAGGHPFYTLETLRALLLAPTADGTLPRPAAASQLIERRLKSLGTPARDLLVLLALAGGDLDPDSAAAALDSRPLDLAPAWAELEAAQLVRGGQVAHDLVREAALTGLPQALHPVLHRALARVLQQRGRCGPARLARHWVGAGCWSEAARAMRQAAADARQAGRLAEQASMLGQAADAHAQAGEQQESFDTRCEAASVTLVLQGDGAALDQIEALAAEARSDAQQARLFALRAEALLNLSRFDEARAASAQACTLAPPGSPLAVDALSLHGRALAMTGNVREGVTLLQQALKAAQSDGDIGRQVVSGAALAHALYGDVQRGQALRVQQQVVALSRQRADDAELAVHLANLATLANAAGDPPATYPPAREAAALFQAQQADGAQRRYNTIMLARAAAALGRLDEAWDLLQPEPLEASGPTPADLGPAATIPTMHRVAAVSVCLWLGHVALARRLLPPLQDDLNPLALAGLLLAHQKVEGVSGAPDGPARRQLLALDRARPGLLDEPALCLEWARLLPPAEGLQRLQRVRPAYTDPACAGLARALDLRALQVRLALGEAGLAAEARRLADELPHGLFASLYPPEAWWTLAQVLRPSDAAAADAAQQRALRWVAEARLPPGRPDLKHAFERQQPLNRVILAEVRVTGG